LHDGLIDLLAVLVRAGDTYGPTFDPKLTPKPARFSTAFFRVPSH